MRGGRERKGRKKKNPQNRLAREKRLTFAAQKEENLKREKFGTTVNNKRNFFPSDFLEKKGRKSGANLITAFVFFLFSTLHPWPFQTHKGRTFFYSLRRLGWRREKIGPDPFLHTNVKDLFSSISGGGGSGNFQSGLI